MLILPVAEACWDIWKLLLLLLPLMLPVPMPLVPLPESSSVSRRFLLPREERTSEVLLLLLLEVARETVTRDAGLGESFNLNITKQTMNSPRELHKGIICCKTLSDQTIMCPEAEGSLSVCVRRAVCKGRTGEPPSETFW